MFDLYGNFLLEFQIENKAEIVQIRGGPSLNSGSGNVPSDVQFVTALASDGLLYRFNYTLKRDKNWRNIAKR